MLLDYDKKREDDYMAGEGSLCPVCGSDQVRQDDPIEVEDGVGTCYCTCDTCGSNWTEIWNLTGITEINTRDKEE